jgi:hypothetical protein
MLLFSITYDSRNRLLSARILLIKEQSKRHCPITDCKYTNKICPRRKIGNFAPDKSSSGYGL